MNTVPSPTAPRSVSDGDRTRTWAYRRYAARGRVYALREQVLRRGHGDDRAAAPARLSLFEALLLLGSSGAVQLNFVVDAATAEDVLEHSDARLFIAGATTRLPRRRDAENPHLWSPRVAARAATRLW